MKKKPRVLHFITVYNGRDFVPRCIESAMRMDKTYVDIDVLILDDKSPEEGWSKELEAYCKKVGAKYYCSPRNLGIPRNCSLGLMTAVKNNYDYVLINNSDTIFPKNLITNLLEVASRPGIGSVTAYSNNVSIFTLPNADPDKYLANQETVDWISAQLGARFSSHETMEIPVGISFCIMMPTDVIRDVGVMDPVFGRGYCEETDWSLRSLQAGYKCALAPNTFVYHQGRGSNVSAGLVSGGHTTVPENEVIIDMRYPTFRDDVAKYEKSEIQDRVNEISIITILRRAALEFGVDVKLDWVHAKSRLQDECVIATVKTLGHMPHILYEFKGFSTKISLETNDIRAEIKKFLGFKIAPNMPKGIHAGNISDAIKSKFIKGISVKYPEEVF